MILKLLLVIGLVAFVYFTFIKKKPEISKKSKDANNKKPKLSSNDMVECSSCGIYSSIDDTILSNNKYYCSKECLEKK
ncbi:MAG: hypothetical protein COB17_05335 [Sulfurimonas sp.]|nr:MAG: hypothetical protein COB17_05335 [Sulfurimonas sp.]